MCNFSLRNFFIIFWWVKLLDFFMDLLGNLNEAIFNNFYRNIRLIEYETKKIIVEELS